MPGFASLALLSLGLISATPAIGASVHSSSAAAACASIQKAISTASAVYYPGSANYTAGKFVEVTGQNVCSIASPQTSTTLLCLRTRTRLVLWSLEQLKMCLPLYELFVFDNLQLRPYNRVVIQMKIIGSTRTPFAVSFSLLT
jgi:hypothetical protein